MPPTSSPLMPTTGSGSGGGGGAINADLSRERARATFTVEKMTHLLDGGVARTQRRRALERVIQNDPTGVFDNTHNIYLHRTERHVRSLAKHVRLVELCRQHHLCEEQNGDIVQSPDFPLLLGAVADDLPTSLHWVMFVPNILTLCDAAQQAAWLPQCRDWRMIGCYAQTELGHGSNVRALETTATFVPERDGGIPGGAWRIHSPTLTSTKFWPGTLGRTANHAMVMARLIDGRHRDCGIHNFLVPLRDHQHELLPGITTGDIGPKIGYNVMDNGYCSFDNVLVPRRNMAMRFATVDKVGTYRKKLSGHDDDAAAKITYMTMMQVRAYIVNEAGKNLAMACTVAIRYSAVRRQGYDEDRRDGAPALAPPPELQILDYQQQQHRLFPLLASSYCFFFTGKKLLERLRALEQRLVHHTQPVTKQEMTDVHASSSALKSFTTTVTADGMEDARKACGGHGFLACSGLPEMVTTYLQSPTVEGDNHMLPQQVIKVLLKLVDVVQDNVGVDAYQPCDAYALVPALQLILRNQTPQCRATSGTDLLDLPSLQDAFCHRAARLLIEVAMLLRASSKTGKKTAAQAWNDGQVAMARASRAYAQFLLLRNFCTGIADEAAPSGNNSSLGAAEVAVLRDLARLWALYWIERDMGDFLEDGYLTARQAQWVRGQVRDLLNIVRPNAVALVDARDFTDFRLKSALGRYDGNVYPHIMAAARQDPLNASEPGPGVEHLRRLTVDGVGVYTGTQARL